MSRSTLRLRDGVPLLSEYDTLSQSAVFKDMEAFSEAFLDSNRSILADYMARWGAENPFRSWSRQWEYPYVFGKVAEMVRVRPQARILDAGSGATFLPFYLKHRFEETTIACCDADGTLEKAYLSLNQSMNSDIGFSTADIRALPYDDQLFDVVYCVSVLEHTDCYEEILREVLRVSNGGGIVVTFDISLDGTRDIRLEDLDRLLQALAVALQSGPDLHSSVKLQLARSGILTTHAVDPDLLPWQGPQLLHRLKSSLANRRLVRWPPLLTVCCLSGPHFSPHSGG